ncbi:prolyl oligopeptidase family serine peptidase [Cupriavidus nantongensis]|uniref:prolyl oligopeptidase family serine peptidase n=1 Tax=Cupriavidus nantongensis TaxID=1796606 RepID=UPI00358FB44F
MYQIQVVVRDVSFDLLVRVPSAPKNILVFGQSAISSRNVLPLPIFHRWTWFVDFPDSVCVALNDPTLYLDETMLGGWFQGTRDHFYMEDGALIVAKIADEMEIDRSRIFFYGSSAGGFSALMMAAMIDGASAIAEIPQTDMARYHVSSAVNALLRNCYGGSTLQEVVAIYPERLSVLRYFEKNQRVPNIMYLQNLADTTHLERHFFPFVAGIERLLDMQKKRGEEKDVRMHAEFYVARTEKGGGHVAAPRNVAIRTIRAAISEFY